MRLYDHSRCPGWHVLKQVTSQRLTPPLFPPRLKCSHPTIRLATRACNETISDYYGQKKEFDKGDFVIRDSSWGTESQARRQLRPRELCRTTLGAQPGPPLDPPAYTTGIAVCALDTVLKRLQPLAPEPGRKPHFAHQSGFPVDSEGSFGSSETFICSVQTRHLSPSSFPHTPTIQFLHAWCLFLGCSLPSACHNPAGPGYTPLKITLKIYHRIGSFTLSLVRKKSTLPSDSFLPDFKGDIWPILLRKMTSSRIEDKHLKSHDLFLVL